MWEHRILQGIKTLNYQPQQDKKKFEKEKKKFKKEAMKTLNTSLFKGEAEEVKSSVPLQPKFSVQELDKESDNSDRSLSDVEEFLNDSASHQSHKP